MVDFQTEHLDNHTARLTVNVEAERIEKAMRQAARRIASKARIKGFRPGKAPYDVIVNLYGREYVLAEAVDKLGQEVYREVLDASDIEPYAPGALEDVKEEDGLQLIFSLPKRPEVELGNYRDDLRAEYEVEEVTDEMVDETMENLRQSKAVVEDVDRAAQVGDQVVMGHIQIEVLPAEDSEDEETEDAAEATEDAAVEDEATDAAETEEEDEAEPENDVLLHRHNWERVLEEDVEKDLFPGFTAEIIGMSKGDEKEFTLVLPEDYEDESLAGRTLKIEAHVEQVQARTVPEWSDDLAKSISEEEHETILDLRIDIRKRLEERAESVANNNLIEAALDQLTEMATLHYPEEMVDDYAEDLLVEMDQNLQQQGIKLDDYLRIMGQSRDELKVQYREGAIKRAERALVLSELLKAEELQISEDDLNTEINRLAAQFGGVDQSAQFLQFLNTPQSRANVSSQLMNDRVLDRLMAIAKGENPPVGPSPVAEEEAAEEAEDVDEATEEAEVAEAVAADETPEPVAEVETTDAAGPEAEEEND